MYSQTKPFTWAKIFFLPTIQVKCVQFPRDIKTYFFTWKQCENSFPLFIHNLEYILMLLDILFCKSSAPEYISVRKWIRFN